MLHMTVHLSDAEIQRRLVKLRNYERLYPELKAKYQKLKQRVKELEAELERERRERRAMEEKLMLQIEELREMVFGRKRGGDDDGLPAPSITAEPPQQKHPRSPNSYRRRTPREKDVTHESFHGIDRCPDCGESLANLREAVRFVEDILLPLPDRNPLKTIERRRVETGFCRSCRKWHSTVPLEKQVCSLGENVRRRIVYCVTVLGMTFEKIQRDLSDTFGIAVSDGEMTRILATEAARLLPEYHDIDARIRGSPCQHLDETSWPVQQEGEGQWGWVRTASNAPDTVFRLGRSRGKGNALSLIPDRDQPTVTDDYAAYDGCTEKHGLCWAHPKRKFQDLAESSALSDERKRHCRNFYERFCALLSAVQVVHASPYDRALHKKHATRFVRTIARLTTEDPVDPIKLATLKTTFRANTERYLLCVREPNIPMTNNKAERSIRPLVIKRKLSFGSRTQKGADVMSVLLSVCLTTWWSKPMNFYAAYEAIISKWRAA